MLDVALRVILWLRVAKGGHGRQHLVQMTEWQKKQYSSKYRQ